MSSAGQSCYPIYRMRMLREQRRESAAKLEALRSRLTDEARACQAYSTALNGGDRRWVIETRAHWLSARDLALRALREGAAA